MNTDLSQQLQQQILDAYQHATPLRIVGGNSKLFYGRQVAGEVLNVSEHQGLLSYEPTELVITARAGTPLKEIEKILESNGQMLPFEPPAFSTHATMGGTIACNLSGPRRAYAGAARDYLLGCKIINGKGEILSFGGEVMKNVAGYDVSRLMAGALGTLGVLLEVSLKVLPKPEMETTQELNCSAVEAIEKMHAWSQTPLPISATSFYDSKLRVRFSGETSAVNAAAKSVGGELLDNATDYWEELKEQRLAFFESDKPLWRLSLASDNEVLALDGDCLYEWGGALRWLKSELTAEDINDAAAKAEGHATLFRHNGGKGLFQPLAPGLLRIHKNLKQAFDPENILNPNKLYADL